MRKFKTKPRIFMESVKDNNFNILRSFQKPVSGLRPETEKQ